MNRCNINFVWSIKNINIAPFFCVVRIKLCEVFQRCFCCCLCLCVDVAAVYFNFVRFSALIEFVSLTIHKMGLFERDSSTHLIKEDSQRVLKMLGETESSL